MRELVVHNPYTGEELGKVPFVTREEAGRGLAQASAAFKRWRHSTAWQRAQLLEGVASDLEKERGEFAELLRKEAGKPIHFATAEVNRAISVLRWAAGEAQRFAGELLRLDAAAGGRPGFGIHTRFPRGVIFGITPFNFPLNLALHKIAPAVACGCSIVIKPSPATPLITLKLAGLFEAREPGLVSAVIADDELTAELTRAPEVAMISFTGSARVGWQVRRQAPEKPTALELGGNAWLVVMPDVPVETYSAIAKRISGAAFGYAGQSCISVQNVAVAAERWKEFRDHLVRATEETVFGNPADEKVVTGPLIHSGSARRVRSALEGAREWDSIISKTRSGSGEVTNLVAPTLVLPSDADFALKSELVSEEIFGPVMVAAKFDEVGEVISRINSSRYGLQAGIYTRDWTVIERFYRDLEVGGVVINDVPTARYDHQPYGGVKESGQGREGVRYAMEEMTESRFLALSSVMG
ncbi:MAG: hypothetical protein A2X94_06310 [Bdellovibrionales bacterium GWB1_55_8]|nr:MAG: hypothetical protein A2X94_06310 [Bdellovibrionales bacterium GWB1_55_8]